MSAQSKPRTTFNRGFWLRVLVSSALIGMLLYNVDLGVLWDQLKQTNWIWLLPALVAYMVSQIVSAERWRLVAAGVHLSASRGQFLRWYLEGMFFSLCLPTSIGGDVIKWYRLARPPGEKRDGERFFLAGCSVLVDRLTGLAALVAIGLGAVAQSQYNLSLGYGLGVVAAILALEAAGMHLVAPALKAGGWLTKRLARLSGLIGKLEPYGKSPHILRRALWISVGVQALNLGVPVLMAQSLGIDVPLHGVLVAAAVTSIASALPVSINGVGVREGAMVVLLKPYGVAKEAAIAISLLWFLVQVIGGLLAGLAWLVEPQSLPDTEQGNVQQGDAEQSGDAEPSQAGA